MTEQIFFQISIIVIVAVIISFIMRLLRQPLLIGYIITGIILGSALTATQISLDNLKTFAQLGVAFLLFIVGLHINPRVIREIGKVALITGTGQVLFTSIIGFLIVKALGFSNLTSIYISIALTFSSTIIITKLLTDKGDLDTLYGKIAIGLLIVQDIIAILVLMVISSSGDISSLPQTLIKGGLIVLILFSLGLWVFPRLLGKIAKSQEVLFLFSLAWCFLISSLFYYLNFSIEIGSLLAGMVLAMSPYAFDISSKIKPLKDFFLIIFFIALGMQMQLSNLSSIIYPGIILSLFILIGNPLILMILLGVLGYTKKTSFFAGLIAAQISEFSIIMIALGAKVSHLSPETLPLITLIGIITITGSSYLLLYADKMYSFLAPYLSIFERKKINKELKEKKEHDALLFGYNRIGFSILKSLNKVTKNYTVIDFNPETISLLRKKNIHCTYADAENSELLDELQLKKTKLAISTIPSLETNLLLIEKIREKSKLAIIIVIAHQIKDALALYRQGADYVILPHFLGGDYASKLIESLGFQKARYKDNKEKHLHYLRERIKEGHEHPRRR